MEILTLVNLKVEFHKDTPLFLVRWNDIKSTCDTLKMHV